MNQQTSSILVGYRLRKDKPHIRKDKGEYRINRMFLFSVSKSNFKLKKHMLCVTRLAAARLYVQEMNKNG